MGVANLPNRHATSSRALWIGALSFESRCVGSVLDLLDSRINVDTGYVLEYPSSGVFPASEDKYKRNMHWEMLEEAGKHVFSNDLVRVPLPPYSGAEIRHFVDDFINDQEYDLLLVDLSCMTKFHAAYFACALSAIGSDISVVVGYTMPDNYSVSSKTINEFGWNDVLISPLSDASSMERDEFSRGLVLLGHESDRLSLSLAELEPMGGSVCIAANSNRPDFHRVTLRNNRDLVKDFERAPNAAWRKATINITQPDRVRDLAEEEIAIAKSNEAPLMLYPFGPKHFVFFATWAMSSHYAEGSWLVYPVPASYNVNYSEGIGDTLWFDAISAQDSAATTPV